LENWNHPKRQVQNNIFGSAGAIPMACHANWIKECSILVPEKDGRHL
jgi:hypothetical protein